MVVDGDDDRAGLRERERKRQGRERGEGPRGSRVLRGSLSGLQKRREARGGQGRVRACGAHALCPPGKRRKTTGEVEMGWAGFSSRPHG